VKRQKNERGSSEKISYFLNVVLILTCLFFLYLYMQGRPVMYITESGTEFAAPLSSEQVLSSVQSNHSYLGDVRNAFLIPEPSFIVTVFNEAEELRTMLHVSAITGEELLIWHVLPNDFSAGSNVIIIEPKDVVDLRIDE